MLMIALFKKKKEELKPEELGFGFPAAEKRKELESTLAPPAPPRPPEEEPMMPPAPPRPPQEPMEPRQVPVTPVVPPTRMRMEMPEVEGRPVSKVMPEEVMPLREPIIKRVRPHVFLKISKYKEVMTSIDDIINLLRSLKKSLTSVKDIDEKEEMKIKESEEVLTKLEGIARRFDQIFSNPEK